MDILIVEDDIISRSILKNMLVEMGNTVIEAEDGEQAWRFLKSRKPKIVISDWMMPGLNGLDLCQKIRSEPFKEYVYVIMLTAKDGQADLVEVFRAGADDYITKPFDPEELRARVMTGSRVIDLETRHKALAHTLIESRNKLRIVFDSFKEEIVSVNREMNIVSVNKAFANRLQRTPAAVVGTNCFDKTISGHTFLCDSGIQSMIANAFENGAGSKILVTAKGDAGHPTYRQINCLPIQDEFKKVVQVVIVSRDITEERQKTEEIHHLNGQLMATPARFEAQNNELKNTVKRLEDTQAQMIQSEKMASIGQLAAGVAHEINDPTGYVSSNLKTLQDYQHDIARLINKYHELFAEFESDRNAKIPVSIRQRLKDIKSFENEIDLGYMLEDIPDLISDCREGAERIKKSSST